MNIYEARGFIKGYFEKLYKKPKEGAPILLKSPGLPDEMTAEGTKDDDGWSVRKLIPSTITDDIAQEEEVFGVKFPTLLKAFLSTYHHGFDMLGCN